MRDRRFVAICAGTSYLKIRALLLNQKHHILRRITRLKQGKGVGTLIALTYVLKLEDPRRFRKCHDAGCYVGLDRVVAFFIG